MRFLFIAACMSICVGTGFCSSHERRVERITNLFCYNTIVAHVKIDNIRQMYVRGTPNVLVYDITVVEVFKPRAPHTFERYIATYTSSDAAPLSNNTHYLVGGSFFTVGGWVISMEYDTPEIVCRDSSCSPVLWTQATSAIVETLRRKC